MERFAQQHGYRIRSLVFEEPEHLSPLVADLHRWWHRQRGLTGNRLLVESFILLEPWWALRLGLVPFWLKFNMEPSADWLESYLDRPEPYDEIQMMLFSHGVDCVGLVPLYPWRMLQQRARQGGTCVGVDTTRFPRDFGSTIRYYTELKKLPSSFPIPAPIELRDLDTFLGESTSPYPVTWDGAPGVRHRAA